MIAPVEAAPDTGHPGSVLAKLVVEAIEAHVRSPGGKSYAAIAKDAGMLQQQLNNLKRAVGRDPTHVIKSDVAERLLAAIGLRVAVVPAAPENGRKP